MATLESRVIQVGRASAIAAAMTTVVRTVDCTSCWAIDRSVSDQRRTRKNSGAIAGKSSQRGSSSSIGRGPMPSTTITLRPPIHASMPK